MTSHPDPSPRLHPELIARLACPVCLAVLQPEENRLICSGCARVYPIIEGIPVLIAERAEAGAASPIP